MKPETNPAVPHQRGFCRQGIAGSTPADGYHKTNILLQGVMTESDYTIEEV